MRSNTLREDNIKLTPARSGGFYFCRAQSQYSIAMIESSTGSPTYKRGEPSLFQKYLDFL